MAFSAADMTTSLVVAVEEEEEGEEEDGVAWDLGGPGFRRPGATEVLGEVPREEEVEGESVPAGRYWSILRWYARRAEIGAERMEREGEAREGKAPGDEEGRGGS